MLNFTNITNALTIAGLATAINDATSGMFGFMLYIAVFLIVFLPTSFIDGKKAFGLASFVSMIVAILLNAMGMLSSEFIIVNMAVLGVSLLLLMFSK